MSEVLVLVDHVDGAVRKPTYELLTIAKRLGEPSAVFIGAGDKADGAVDSVKKYGAEKVYVVDDAEIKGYLVAPKAEALQQLAADATTAHRSPGYAPAACRDARSAAGCEAP
jgi:electron transfer flavoprotein alpha subunit